MQFLISSFLENVISFLEELFVRISKQNYRKKKIDLWIYNDYDQNDNVVDIFLKNFKSEYKSVSIFKSDVNLDKKEMRVKSVEDCVAKKCDYYLSLDGIAHLDHPDTINLLMAYDKAIVPPLIIWPFSMFSIFWGAITPDGK